MGGRRSTRWNGHRKRRLVEESLAVDLVKMRRAGLLGDAGGCSVATWTTDSQVTARGVLSIGGAKEAGRALELEIHTVWTDAPVRTQLRLLPFRPHLGGRRWFVECPQCEKRFLRVYLSWAGGEVACRRCHGLVHRSAQQHDARVDLARRDPRRFRESRAGLRGLRSRLATGRLIHSAFENMAARRLGRGWGVKSMTSYKRVMDQLLGEASQPLEQGRRVD